MQPAAGDAGGAVGAAYAAYHGYLGQARKLNGTGFVYQLMNALGSAGIIYSLVFAFNLPAMLLEIAWLLISIYGMIQSRRARIAAH